MKRGLVVILILLGCGALVFAQTETEESGELTIEELYLSQNIELQIIRSQAMSNDRDMKLLSLQTIRSMLEDGTLDKNNAGVYTVLESLANEGTGRVVRSSGRVVNDFPMVRKDAAKLLGEIGGAQATRTLTSILVDDTEPMVLAEAVYSLGTIGSREDIDLSGVLSSIAWTLRNETAKAAPDNNFAFASLLTIEKLAKANDGIADPELLNALLEVASGNYIKAVRLKAIDVIYTMRKIKNSGK